MRFSAARRCQSVSLHEDSFGEDPDVASSSDEALPQMTQASKAPECLFAVRFATFGSRFRNTASARPPGFLVGLTQNPLPTKFPAFGLPHKAFSFSRRRLPPPVCRVSVPDPHFPTPVVASSRPVGHVPFSACGVWGRCRPSSVSGRCPIREAGPIFCLCDSAFLFAGGTYGRR
jgi:hypothetical protein